jgi:predicted transcriptional regulator
MSCVDDISKAITDSIRSAESVYDENKDARLSFTFSEDASEGLDTVDEMIYNLEMWANKIRRVRDAARSCR